MLTCSRSVFAPCLIGAALVATATAQQLPRGFASPAGNAPPIPAGSVLISINNLDELRIGLPDPELASDLLRSIGSDLWMGQSRHASGVEAIDYAMELIRLSAPKSANQLGSRGLNGKYIIHVGPIDDFDDFVGSIDYGTVLAESTSTRTVEIEIDPEAITRENLMELAKRRGPAAVDQLEDTLEGRSRFHSRDDRPADTQRLGADFAEGDYVEATIEGKSYQGRIIGSKEGSFDRPLFEVEMLDKDAFEKLLDDRKLRRRLEAVDRLVIWMPPNRMRRMRGAPIAAQGERTWTDTTGGFSVEATFVAFEGERVVLRLASGKEVKVPLAKLSEEDRGHLEELKNLDANPFASDTPRSQSLPAEWGRVKTIANRTSSRWRWKPPQIPPPRVLDSPNRRFDLTTQVGKGPGGTSLEELFLSDDATVGIAVMDAGHIERKTRLQRFKVTTGEVEPLIECPDGSRVLDASPSDGLVVLTPEGRGSRGDDSRVFLSRLEGDQLVSVCDFDTRGPDSDPEELISARLLSDSRLATWDWGDRFTIWDYKTATAIYTMELDGGRDDPMIVGPGGRFIFTASSRRLSVIDSINGKVVATLPYNSMSIDKLSVDKRMKRVSLTAEGKIFTLDLSSGKVMHSLFGFKGRGDIDYIGKFLLYDGRFLIAPDYPVILWQYVMADGEDYDPHAAIRGKRLWYATRTGRGDDTAWSIASIDLPHDGVRNMMKGLGNLDDLILLTEGDKITVETDTDLDAGTTEKLRMAIGGAFQKSGFKIVPKEKATAETKQVVITCKKAAGPMTIKIDKYVRETGQNNPAPFNPPPGFAIPRMPGFGGNNWVEETHTVTPYQSSIEIRHQGEVLWSDGITIRDGQKFPNFRGDPIQQVLKRITEPNLQFLLATELPAQICRKGPVGGTFGASFINADGIVEDYLGDEDDAAPE